MILALMFGRGFVLNAQLTSEKKHPKNPGVVDAVGTLIEVVH